MPVKLPVDNRGDRLHLGVGVFPLSRDYRLIYRDGEESTDWAGWELIATEQDEDHAMVLCRFYDEKEANMFLNAIRWFETFSQGRIGAPVQQAPKTTRNRSHKSVKP